MAEEKIKIVVLERSSVGLDVSISMFEELGEVTAYNNTKYSEIAERVKDADIVVANKSRLNADTLGEAKNVKLICEFATGFDNVDLNYCKERGIGVCNVRNYCTAMVAQHTFALALFLSEKLSHYDLYVKSGQYASQERFSNFDIPFYELEGKTWGIIGMGNIGQRVAKIAEAFGCKVIFYSVTGNSTVTNYERVDLDTLLAESDYVSIHCPLSDITRNLINEETISKMKESAYLINVARGPIVNEEALYHALVDGKIAGAGLDVLCNEPIQSDSYLAKIQDSTKLIITPHLAWASVEARERCVEFNYDNIKEFLKGGRLNRIDE
ncbi:MAG: D-2-hydroxyacid dehydrogenase [Lachnospiraceae bacterium]|nr:D-2-hydroxyacid dehydrogenase [Lachnospiraceae bacterium]